MGWISTLAIWGGGTLGALAVIGLLMQVFRHGDQRACPECHKRWAASRETGSRFCEYSRSSILKDYEATCRRCGHTWTYTRRHGTPGRPAWKDD